MPDLSVLLIARAPIDLRRTGSTDQRSGDTFEMIDTAAAKALVGEGLADYVEAPPAKAKKGKPESMS